jgi:hypothetical protein
LVLDEPAEDDHVTTVSDIPFYINPESIKQIDDKIILDFNQSYGYIIKTENEILQFGVKLQT